MRLITNSVDGGDNLVCGWVNASNYIRVSVTWHPDGVSSKRHFFGHIQMPFCENLSWFWSCRVMGRWRSFDLSDQVSLLFGEPQIAVRSSRNVIRYAASRRNLKLGQFATGGHAPDFVRTVAGEP